jgi:P2-related tail formation protein
MSINKTSNNQKMKKLDESPTIADIVSIELLTPGSDECFISNPYKVDKVTIYSLGRNHFSGTPFVFEESHLDPKVLVEYEKAKAIACAYAYATGTVTIDASQYLVATTHYITITTTDGTVITATASADTTTTTDTNSPTWELEGSDSWSTGDNLATCLNANSKLTATSTHTGVVTITQVDAGEAGNTTIVLTDPDGEGMSKTDFAGGLPTKAQLKEVERFKTELNETVSKNSNYYSELVPVKVIGDESNPAWLSTDTDNAFIENVPTDEDGNNQFGYFKYNWNPVQSREGDYIVCWTWTPNAAGDSISSFLKFNLEGSTVLTTSIPTHFTNPEKYTTLLERYLPEVYKSKLSEADVTPDTLDKFHKAIAKGFTFVEDMANQSVDLLDANSTHESLLNLLSNMFNLRLKSDDPTLWRRQIKTAVPLFKRKGTGGSLKESFLQADIKLKKVTKLWQITSPYTWQESFEVADSNTLNLGDTDQGETQVELEKVALGSSDTDNNVLYRRPVGASSYTELVLADHVTFSTSEGVTTMTWESSSSITLAEGDLVKIVYEVVNVPGSSEQTVEDYIRSLPLADQRDETLQDYPLKNWNVRLVEEDDTLFDVLIPDRHPFHDSVLYGKIRTEFPYSENIYNMEEYNGSLRDSTDPCHLDKYFVDKCQYCQSSKFNLDLEIKDLSTDRINEAESIVEEYTPFHSVLHQINFSGGFDEFVLSPIENLEGTVKYSITENILSGNQQKVFFRAMFADAFTSSTQATGTVTITDYTELNSGDTVNLISTDGTNYDFVNGSQDSVSGTWESDASNNQTATNLATVINTSSGPSGTRFSASAVGAVVTIKQSTFGADGNTTITLTDSGTAGMSKTDFANGFSSGFVKRNMLAFSTTEVSSQSATGFNDNITIYAPDVRFDLLPLDTSSNVLKILSPSVNAGNYSITSPDTHMANISGITEPLNTSSFTFMLSNDSYSGTAAIEQDDVFAFSDTTVDFIEKGVKTDWDDNNDSSYTGTAWKIQITETGFSNGIYTISRIESDGSLILNDPTEALPKSNSSSLSYNILDDSNNNMSSSDNGSLAISRRAKITDSSPSGDATDDIRDVSDISDYFVLSGTEYKIIGFVESQDHQFYISGYTAGDASGQSFNVYKRLVDSETGYVDYRGMKIVTSSDHEAGLGIVNGSNPPATVVDDNLFKENFLVLIGSNYYKITGIDGTTINVDGPEESWKVSGGTSVTYSILKYSKENISIQPKAGYGGETEGYSGETVDGLPYVQPAMYQYLGHDFNFIDRRGNEVISLNTETAAPFAAFAAEALNANDDQIKEPISQEENITLEIEWADDEEIEGDNN